MSNSSNAFPSTNILTQRRRYNGFVTFFLQSRGADFGDGSLYITYRNVSHLSKCSYEKFHCVNLGAYSKSS